jgi:hypothetical protein
MKFFLFNEKEMQELWLVAYSLKDNGEALDKALAAASRLDVKTDPRDGLVECERGPHFYDPSELPDDAVRELCPDCQPDEDDHSDGVSEAERVEFLADLQENR